MLPSTGYFKGINCPFYDSGLCQRPYCHFRHARKDPHLAAGDSIDNGAILQQLVSEAVKKVLQQTDPSATAAMSVAKNLPATTLATTKLTYNPTPIAELQKINSSDGATGLSDEDLKPRRHIPVPYTPHRPATAPVKRSVVDSDASKPFIYNPPDTYSPGSGDGIKPDPYLPQGATSNGKYEPGAEVELQTYTPPTASCTSSGSDKPSYVPSEISDKPAAKKKIIEYEPTRASVNAGMSKYIQDKSKDGLHRPRTKEHSGLKYQPTPLNKVPCFSSDEDEPEIKKKKSSKDNSDLNGLDLESEFEMLGQILDEEETPESIKAGKSKKRSDRSNKQGDKDKDGTKEKQRDKGNIKDNDKTDEDKSSSKKEHRTSREKDKRDIDKVKTGSSKTHKSSHKDKQGKEQDKLKHSDKSHKERASSKQSSSKNSSHYSEKTGNRTSSSKSHSTSTKDSKSKKSHRSDSHKDNKNHKKENRSSREKDKHKKSNKEASSKLDDINGFSDVLVTISDDDNNVDELIEELSDADEDTIAMECMKIFEEYVPTSKSNQGETEHKHDEIEAYIPTKKRISHAVDKNVKVIDRKPIKPDFKVGAAQAMAERLAKVREYHALKNISTNTVVPENTFIQNTDMPTATPSQSKVRIAHVPNVSIYGKKPVSSSQLDKSQPSTSATTVHTIPKGSSRMAHIPNEKFCDRPGVLEPLASKIPANMRSIYLNKMIDECLKIYVTPTDAYARAQQEELTTSKKCTTIPIYKNSAVLAVSRLRKEFQECNGIKKTSLEIDSKVSHSQVLIGKLAQTSWSIVRSKKVDFSHEFKGIKFYNNVSRWVLDEDQLQQNGFPRLHPDGEKGRAIVYATHDKQIPPRGRLRNCCRCKKDFMVDKRGFPAVKEDCNYHPSRKYRVRGEVRYQCCSQDGTSEGCAIAPSHVFDYVDFDNLRGFVKTMPKDVSDPENYDYGVYALDCEMCYTTHGLDLTRITVINSSCKTVYETLIRPLHPIVDYNTQYSGITEEHMADVSTTLLEVQATLLSMFSDKTILIGHSLESDFKALKLIHNTVVDTSVLFPHKMGPPYKRALRNLSSEHLKKIIQNSVDGHDSAEDATVCMELIHFKLKEELKLR